MECFPPQLEISVALLITMSMLEGHGSSPENVNNGARPTAQQRQQQVQQQVGRLALSSTCAVGCLLS